MKKSNLLATLALGALALPLSAQQPAAQPTPRQKPPDCSAPEFRQFDFWLGEWNVSGPKGVQQGVNRIESIEKGCALKESWNGGGMTGTSLNAYDRTTKRWMQTWVSSTGGILQIAGGMEGGKMVMSGDRVDQGKPTRHRITWEKLDDGRVRQVWDSSVDAGKTWSVLFEGFYAKK